MVVAFLLGVSGPLLSKPCPQACRRAALATRGSLRCGIDIFTKFPGDLHTLSSWRSLGSDTFVPPACCSSTFLSLFCGFADFALLPSLKAVDQTGLAALPAPVPSGVQLPAALPGCWGRLGGGA